MLDTTIEAINELIKASQTADQWDQMPILILLHADDSGSMVMMPQNDPIGGMRTIPGYVNSGESGFSTSPIVGAVLYVEAWGLSADVSETGAGEKLAKEIADLKSRGLRYSDHPAAIEIKMFHAVDEQGHISRQIHRGSSEVITLPDTAKESGRLVDYMTTMFMELTQ